MIERLKRRKPESSAPAEQAEIPPVRTRDPFAIRPTASRIEQTLAHAAALANPRHELFAHAIVAGIDRVTAYERAGYDGVNSYAGGTALLARVEIALRIATLQGKAAERAVVTVETLVDELEEARVLAKAHDQPTAMVAATKEKAVLLGLRVEKRDITTREGDPRGLTDDELARIARTGGDGAAAPEGDQEEPARVVH